MVMRNTLYSLLILVSGLYIHEQHAGNGSISKEVRVDENKKDSIVKIARRGCWSCKHYDDQEKNPCWRPCGTKDFLHKICKSKPIYALWESCFSPWLWERNKRGFLPLSIAIFRGKKTDVFEKEDSCKMVKYITEKAGEDVFNMVMLRDHAGCSAWMHSIYIGNVENIKTIVLAVANQVKEPEDALWKLLTTEYSGGDGYYISTPLMVAVKQKNIPVIKLLKDIAGERFNEYVAIERQSLWKKSARGKKTAIDFAGDDAEIIELLSTY